MKIFYSLILVSISLFGSQAYENALKLLDKSQEEGMQEIVKLANSGDVDAQLDMYDLYNQGVYFKKDSKKAMYWIKKAASANANAMAILGAKYIQNAKYNEGVKYLNKAAKASNPLGLYVLGSLYLDGIGVEQSCTTSTNYFNKAAELGQPQAAQYIFWAYKDGNKCIKKNDKEAEKWLYKAAKLDGTSALRALGFAQLSDKQVYNVKQNYKEGENNLRKAAELGDIEAMFLLGQEYEFAWRLKQNYQEAVKLYTTASDNGHILAKYRLGTFYNRGLSVHKDEKKACDLFEQSISYPGSEYNLAVCYQDGEGGRNKDRQKASKYFLMAAEKSYLSAQSTLGMDYEFGRAGVKDYKKARYWYEKAANNHDGVDTSLDVEKQRIIAKNNLAILLEQGKGGARDYRQAFILFKENAEAGLVSAQNSLAVMYLEAKGTTKDVIKAKYWLKKAAAQGNQNAIKNLSLLN